MGCEELFGWSNTKQKGAQEQNRDALSEMEVNECVHQMFAQMPLGGKQLTKKRKRKRWKENVKMKRHKSVLTKIDKWLKRKGKHKQKVKRKTSQIELSIHDRELLVELLLHRTKITTRQKSNSGKWKKRHKLRNKPKKFVKTWQFKFKARNQHILPRTKHDIPNKRTQCLIVLNDIWATDAWDCLQHVFPHGTGSNIIFPTWNREVAFYADPRGVLHAPKFLTSDDSWELLENISLSGREISELKLVRKLAGIGKQMAIRCRGLPLALTVLGGVLAIKKTLHERQRVQETINIYVSNGGGCTRIQNMMVADVLSLSYEDLPFLLKQCFLYSAHYPEDYEVHVGTLVGYWIAEGMVTPVQHMEAGKTVEAIGQAYIEELVKSNMVMIGKRDIVTSDVMTCRMHDLMREVCSQKAEHERFVQVLDSMQPNEAAAFPFKLLKLRLSLLTNTSRRISVQVHGGAAEHRIERLFSQGKLYIPTGIRTFRRLRHLCMPSALERSINLSSQNTDFEVVSSLRTVLKRLCGLTIHVVYELMFPVDVTQLVSVFAYLSELEATVLSRPCLYKSQ